MNRLQALTEEFKGKYERFLIGCDALEELGLWDKGAHGEMDVYYENEMLGVILRFITADGNVSRREVEYLDRCFGFDYTADKLKELYANCEEEIAHIFDERFENGLGVMRALNEKLADAYKELLGIVCDIIIGSDGFVAPAEIALAREMKALF